MFRAGDRSGLGLPSAQPNRSGNAAIAVDLRGNLEERIRRLVYCAFLWQLLGRSSGSCLCPDESLSFSKAERGGP